MRRRHYRGYRRRGVYVSPILLAVGLAVIVLGVYLIVRAGGGGNMQLPDDSTVSSQAGQTDVGADAGEEQAGEMPPEEPENLTTASGVLCVLTQLDADAIHTGDLVLVNNWTYYHFPEEEELVCVYEERSGSYIVARMDIFLKPVAMDALNAMLDDFRAQGGSKTVNVVAGHRTAEYQQGLFDRSAERNGLEHAQKYVAQPGGSEHHTGLVVDFSIMNADGSSSEYDGTGEYAWINENCQKYGYVVRYDSAKEALTGIANEPWHFRYVGVPHATQMAKLGLCMEEYMDYLKDFTFEGERLTISCDTGTYEVWYTEGTEVYLPESGEYRVSGNNTDGIIVTCKVA